MKKLLSVGMGLLVVTCGGTAARGLTVYTGLYGQTVEGSCSASLPYISDVQNTSSLPGMMSTVGNGNEFTVSFDDIFSDRWLVSVDFQNNYEVTIHSSSSNPNANIGSGTLIQWQFSGFNFPIGNLTLVSAPPNSQRSTFTSNSHSITIGFNSLAAYAPYNSYTYQIVPVPEPTTLGLFGLGATLLAFARRRRRS